MRAWLNLVGFLFFLSSFLLLFFFFLRGTDFLLPAKKCNSAEGQINFSGERADEKVMSGNGARKHSGEKGSQLRTRSETVTSTTIFLKSVFEDQAGNLIAAFILQINKSEAQVLPRVILHLFPIGCQFVFNPPVAN